jgi:ubiquinone/menaquinone biosynthesis C-methylase UbiE
LKFIANKVVLDVACGTGYGTWILSQEAELAIGLDISKETLTYAKNRFGRTSNVEFILSDAHYLPFRTGAYDTVVSFETLEHMIRYEDFVRDVTRVLRKNGMFIVSTPNRKLTSPREGQPPNPFHVKEFSVEEISQLLNVFFSAFQLYGQSYYTIRDWFSKFLNSFLPLSSFAGQFRKLKTSVESLFKISNTKRMEAVNQPTSFLVVDSSYRVRRFRNIYPFYSPNFLVAAAIR